PFQRILATLEHFRSEVNAAVAGGLRSNQRSAPTQAFAGQHARKFISEPLVLPEQEANLPSPHSYIARRNVGVGANVPIQLGHETLAKAHHFIVAFALGIEVRTPFAAPNGKSSKRVLEYLFECQELQNSQIHRGVKTKASFVRTNRAVHLDAEAAVDLYLALVIEPWNTKHEDPFGFHHALQDACLLVLRVLGHRRTQGLENFLDRLVKLELSRVLRSDCAHDIINVVARDLYFRCCQNTGIHVLVS